MPTFYFNNDLCIHIFHFNITLKCLYEHVFLFKNFNINFMLYLIYTIQYYTICLHFSLTTICGYAFYYNTIYMCLYLHVFLFKNFNINFMLYIFYTGPYNTICFYFTFITTRAYTFHLNISYKYASYFNITYTVSF